MSKKTTQFLDLADIPLRCIFQYLSIRDRFTLFFDLRSCRIQSLLENFISFVNVTNEDEEWIEKYIPEALLQRKILGLRLRNEQIRYVSEYFSLGDIERIYLISTNINDKLSTHACIPLCQSLNKLVLLRDRKMRHKKIKIYPIIGRDLTFQNLTDLSMSLSTICDIFNILQRLPNLEILKMHLEDSYSYNDEKIDINNIESCKMLCTVTITGETQYRHELSTFFAAFGSTIQFLTLNITIYEAQPFLAQFEHDLLDQMFLLSTFNFYIKWHWWSIDSDETFFIDIQTFQNTNWQRFGPVVCWNETCEFDRIIFNLPYKFRCFDIMTRDLNLLYTESKQRPPVFEHVRTILLRNKDPWWSMETFSFIRNSFPNLRTLYFHCKLEEMDDSYMETYEPRFPEIFDDGFRNNQLQLPTVTVACLNIEREQFNIGTFQCLFNLLPNLKVIKTDTPENTRKCQKFVAHYYNDVVNAKVERCRIEPLDNPRYTDSINRLFYYLCES